MVSRIYLVWVLWFLFGLGMYGMFLLWVLVLWWFVVRVACFFWVDYVCGFASLSLGCVILGFSDFGLAIFCLIVLGLSNLLF